MQKTLLLPFLTVTLFLLAADTITVEGFKAEKSWEGASKTPGEVIVRTAAENHYINLSKVSKKTAALLSKSSGKTKLNLDIPKEAIRTEKVPMGIRPDCTELPTSYEELKGIAESPKVKTQQDFLNLIPPGSLQTFTLVFNSDSAQSPGISSEYPGVIRMSADGKFFLRYTCDPNSEVYGTIEMIRYTGGDPAYEFLQFDFRPQKEGKPHPIVSPKNMDLCLGCHNQSSEVLDPRPNWAMYPEWPGIFGSEDDFFPNKPNAQKEKDAFDKFRNEKLKDSCYSSLPWPQGAVKEEWRNYPFGVEMRSKTYSLRPNLKFTEISSHLLAQKNFKRMKRHEHYERIKRLLALEAARCEYPGLHDKIKSILPDYSKADESQAHIPILRGKPVPQNEPRHPASGAQVLFSASLEMGFQPGDWTLLFGESDRSDFETGAGREGNLDFEEGDLPLTAFVHNEILKDMATVLPKIKGEFSSTRAESEYFGEQFGCIDEIIGATKYTSGDSHDKICKALKEEWERYEKDDLKKLEPILPKPKTRGLPRGPIGPYPEPVRRPKKAKGIGDSMRGKIPPPVLQENHY